MKICGKTGWGIDSTGEPRDRCKKRDSADRDGDRTYRHGDTQRLQKETTSRRRHTHMDGQRRNRGTYEWDKQLNQSALENSMDSWGTCYLTCAPIIPPSSAP